MSDKQDEQPEEKNWFRKLLSVFFRDFALAFVVGFVLTLMGANLTQILAAMGVIGAWGLLPFGKSD